MKILSANFVKSAVAPLHYPPASLPEIAFAGKSNVGKSALINTLAQRKGLAKTSNSPGCTQMINFFTVNDELSLVDLPGYGYAKVPLAVKNKWGPMVESYLKERSSLRLVLFVLDIRRDPNENDLAMYRWLEFYRIPYLLVLTKIDKLSRQQIMLHRQTILDFFSHPLVPAVLFSARTGAGKEELWREIEKIFLSGIMLDG
jgi:GTP-binding protein